MPYKLCQLCFKRLPIYYFKNTDKCILCYRLPAISR